MPITPLPQAPQRGNRDTFRSLADPWVAALDPWTTQVNATSDHVDSVKVDVEELKTDVITEKDLAIAARDKAAEWASKPSGNVEDGVNTPDWSAKQYSQRAKDWAQADVDVDVDGEGGRSAKHYSEVANAAALASANYKGPWSTLTGALTVPSSASHEGKFWMLKEDVADVTTEEPGVSLKWQVTSQVMPIGTMYQVGFGVDAGDDFMLMDDQLYLAAEYPGIFEALGGTFFIDSKVVTGTPTLAGTGLGVFADDSYVYVAHSVSPFFTVINKSNWEVVSGTPTLPNTGRGVFADDTHVYVAHSTTPFFTVINKSNWEVVTGTPTLDDTGNGVFADDTYVYVAHGGTPFFTVINKSNWEVVTGTPTLAGIGNGVFADDSYVYVAHLGSPFFNAIEINKDEFKLHRPPAAFNASWIIKVK